MLFLIFFVSSHLDIPVWASSGWLEPLDELIAPYWESTMKTSSASVGFRDLRWQLGSVPQDIEVRMVFYRDHLQALGWTEEEIADLARRVEWRKSSSCLIS